MMKIEKILVLGIVFFLTSFEVLANDDVTKKAKKVLTGSTVLDLKFNSGFSGEPAVANVALLYLLSEPDIVPFFEKLTDRSGVSSIYGLVGLRHINPESDVYRKRLEMVLKRDAEIEVKTAMGDVLSESNVKELITVPARGRKKRLVYGEYFAENFASLPDESVYYVVDNGLRGEAMLNPYMAYVFPKDPQEVKKMNLSVREKEQFKIAGRIVDEKLLHRAPREVLKLAGFKKDDDILKYLTEAGEGRDE